MILYQKLKDSKANLKKSDFDEHYFAHKKFLNTMSKANQLEQSINFMSGQGGPPNVSTLSRSPSKAYMTSQRSTTTLPPINDIRSPRRSVPVNATFSRHGGLSQSVDNHQEPANNNMNSMIIPVQRDSVLQTDKGVIEPAEVLLMSPIPAKEDNIDEKHKSMKTPGNKVLPKIHNNASALERLSAKSKPGRIETQQRFSTLTTAPKMSYTTKNASNKKFMQLRNHGLGGGTGSSPTNNMILISPRQAYN